MERIKLMIVDDHNTLLEGLQFMLSNVADIEIVNVASDGVELIEKMKDIPADVVMMDIQMPRKDGFESTAELLKKFPSARVLILSMHSEKVFIEKMFQLGALGYIMKSSSRNEIIEAIRSVAQGKKYRSNEVTLALTESNASDTSSVLSSELTKREIEILKLIVQGHNNPSIAARLFLSVDTIKTHRKNLKRKLKIDSTAGLVKYALKNLGNV